MACLPPSHVLDRSTGGAPVPRKVQTLAYGDRSCDQRRFASQQRQERGDLLCVRQHVINREYRARVQDPNRVRPPTRILDAFRVKEEEIETAIGESREICAAGLLPQVD